MESFSCFLEYDKKELCEAITVNRAGYCPRLSAHLNVAKAINYNFFTIVVGHFLLLFFNVTLKKIKINKSSKKQFHSLFGIGRNKIK